MKRRTCIRAGALTALAVLSSAPTKAAGDDNALLGTWRLMSFVRETADTGERYNQLGDHPDGYISYASDGRMYVMLVSGDRPRPSSVPTDDERVALHKSMLAYGGPFRVEGNKVTHHLDIAWDNTRLGTDQLRFFAIQGNTLTLRTERNKSPVDGREGVGILVFERVGPIR
jgi:hypothetical protein